MIYLLNSDFINAKVLCFTEYQLMEEQLRVLKTDYFKSVSNCSSFSSNHGGFCIFVKKIGKLKKLTT
jgi:hypothetical protein